MSGMAENFPLLTASAGIALMLLGVGYLAVASWLTPAGRHAMSRQPRHAGWEGREDELHRFTVAYLVERNTPRWPVVDMDTTEFPAVGVS